MLACPASFFKKDSRQAGMTGNVILLMNSLVSGLDLAIHLFDDYNLNMYKRILAAVNEFTNSETAARYAIALARSCMAKLSFVHVAEDRVRREAFTHAESALERLFIEAEEHDVEVESITERGKPLEKIAEIVRKNDIDIVFTATRREDIERRFFVKTLARDLVVKLPCSVAMVRVVRMGRVFPKNILVPLRSYITHSEERACFVAHLAHAFGAKVTIFHLHKPITSFFHGDIHLKPAQRETYIPRDIEAFTGCLKKYEILHEKRTGYGIISRSITIEAAHRRNDLIVMGASERNLLKSIIRGNPVEEVLRETPCNLIILRPGH
jgi:nucleotide-binding universal stress UspA family protein